MTDLDERLRTAGESFRAQPVPDLDLRWPEQKRSQRWLAPLAVAAAVALVVGGAVAVTSLHHDAAQPAKPVPVLVPDVHFAVVAPPTYSHGGAPQLQPLPPKCVVESLTATAQTRQAVDGVVGLISISGAKCSATIDPASIRLVDADGKTVLGPARGANPGLNRALTMGTGTGALQVGFAWTGSFCGKSRISIAVDVNGSPSRTALHGPVPACQSHTSGQLIAGSVVGDVGTPVLPAPAAWKALRAKVILPATLPYDRPFALTVELSNTSQRDIALTVPCASWYANLNVDHLGWGTGTGRGGNLCSRPLVVKPGVPVTLHLGTLPLGTSGAEVRGAVVRVDWAITGVTAPTAKAVIQ
jgi:hypothetical protein